MLQPAMDGRTFARPGDTDATADPPALVSIVVIFLNAARFLEEAIASVLGQTYPAWELLLVDDGSSDGSTDLAMRHARAHPGRVRYLDHDGHRNLGMSASRNLGIRHATGKYIALLDADDVWLPDKLARPVGAGRRSPAIPSLRSSGGTGNGDSSGKCEQNTLGRHADGNETLVPDREANRAPRVRRCQEIGGLSQAPPQSLAASACLSGARLTVPDFLTPSQQAVAAKPSIGSN